MQISYNKDGGVIRYDESDWLYGLIPQFKNTLNNIMNNNNYNSNEFIQILNDFLY